MEHMQHVLEVKILATFFAVVLALLGNFQLLRHADVRRQPGDNHHQVLGSLYTVGAVLLMLLVLR